MPVQLVAVPSALLASFALMRPSRISVPSFMRMSFGNMAATRARSRSAVALRPGRSSHFAKSSLGSNVPEIVALPRSHVSSARSMRTPFGVVSIVSGSSSFCSFKCSSPSCALRISRSAIVSVPLALICDVPSTVTTMSLVSVPTIFVVLSTNRFTSGVANSIGKFSDFSFASIPLPMLTSASILPPDFVPLVSPRKRATIGAAVSRGRSAFASTFANVHVWFSSASRRTIVPLTTLIAMAGRLVLGSDLSSR